MSDGPLDALTKGGLAGAVALVTGWVARVILKRQDSRDRRETYWQQEQDKQRASYIKEIEFLRERVEELTERDQKNVARIATSDAEKIVLNAKVSDLQKEVDRLREELDELRKKWEAEHK